MKNFRIEKNVKISKKSNCFTSVFDQKLFITIFLINDFFGQITFSCSLWRSLLVHEVQKFGIKILTKIAYSNFKIEQK